MIILSLFQSLRRWIILPFPCLPTQIHFPKRKDKETRLVLCGLLCDGCCCGNWRQHVQSAFFCCFSVAKSCPTLCNPMDCRDVLEQYEVSWSRGSLCCLHLCANDSWYVALSLGAFSGCSARIYLHGCPLASASVSRRSSAGENSCLWCRGAVMIQTLLYPKQIANFSSMGKRIHYKI